MLVSLRRSTATASGGSGSYTSYQWYVDGSAQTGQTASTFSYSPASAGSYSITVTVTDSLGATSAQSTAATVTVNSALVAPTVTPTPGTVDQGQTSSLTSTAVTTGTSPYTYQWFEKAPGGSYVTVGSNSGSFSFATSGSTATGSWSFILQVTDNTGAAVNFYCCLGYGESCSDCEYCAGWSGYFRCWSSSDFYGQCFWRYGNTYLSVVPERFTSWK